MTELNYSPAGPILDALGVELGLADGQQVTEAVVVAKVADFNDGETALAITYSKGLDWVARRGLLSAGLYMLDNTGGICTCSDEG